MKKIERVIEDGARYGTHVTVQYDDEATNEFRYNVITDFNDMWFRYSVDMEAWVYLPQGPRTTVDREITITKSLMKDADEEGTIPPEVWEMLDELRKL